MKLFAIGAECRRLVVGQSNYVLLVDLKSGRELFAGNRTGHNEDAHPLMHPARQLKLF